MLATQSHTNSFKKCYYCCLKSQILVNFVPFLMVRSFLKKIVFIYLLFAKFKLFCQLYPYFHFKTELYLIFTNALILLSSRNEKKG